MNYGELTGVTLTGVTVLRSAPELREAPPLVIVKVGSRIRFTTAQLRRLDELPDHCSSLLEVDRLVREADGSITVGVKPVLEGIA